jgi:hypothetical protein
MSMQEIPASGYVVEALTLLPTLIDFQNLYEKAIIEKDLEYAQEILDEYVDDYSPVPIELFILQDEDYSDSLEHGIVYALFDDDDLYVKKPTKQLQHIQSLEITPEYERWTVFG